MSEISDTLHFQWNLLTRKFQKIWQCFVQGYPPRRQGVNWKYIGRLEYIQGIFRTSDARLVYVLGVS